MVILYIKNVLIALARIIKATLWIYRYHPEDNYFVNWWVVVDCFCNALALGDPDETISSRCAKAQAYEQGQGQYGGGCRMCSFLAAFQQNHCQKALERLVGHRAIIKDE